MFVRRKGTRRASSVRCAEKIGPLKRHAMMALLGVALVAAPGRGAEKPLVLEIWAGPVAGDSPAPRGQYGPIGREMFRPPETSPTQDARWLTNVTRPSITVYRPSKGKNTGTAMVICPGGGYWNLAWDLEGEEVAAWLNAQGITGIVLKYRVPRRAGQPEALPAPGPLLDAQRAVSLVRSRAADWGIDPARIGIGGLSAGGHLALATAINFENRGYEPVDSADAVSCRPDFAVAVYPGYLVAKEHPSGVSTFTRIPRGTPPVMLVHAGDDTVSDAENSVVMYQALRNAGVRAELHLYASGGHGFGVRPGKGPCSEWTDRCLVWLQKEGLWNSVGRSRRARLSDR
jgi:acetyl esterase/lipase